MGCTAHGSACGQVQPCNKHRNDHNRCGWPAPAEGPGQVSTRETIIGLVDTLVWLGAGVAIIAAVAFCARAVRRRYVHINGKKATLREEPLGYLLVLAAFVGVIYFLWPLFWGGAQGWLQ